jgi:hypothetical protein
MQHIYSNRDVGVRNYRTKYDNEKLREAMKAKKDIVTEMDMQSLQVISALCAVCCYARDGNKIW